jgi:hypothetical protein
MPIPLVERSPFIGVVATQPCAETPLRDTVTESWGKCQRALASEKAMRESEEMR